jgi:hypothetical protein
MIDREKPVFKAEGIRRLSSQLRINAGHENK